MFYLNQPIVIFLKIFRKIERGFKRIHRPFVMRRLRLNNLNSEKSILSSEGPVVTLTSFEPRINDVFYAIESIAEGTLRPCRLSLWLEHYLIERGLPDSLVRLQSRGLEILGVEDFGPHKKYLPEVMSGKDLSKPFVTADDDTLYPKYWLKQLVNTSKRNPNDICCFRAHHIQFDENGAFKPYLNWKPCLSLNASHLHFSTGSCGVLFPSKMRSALRQCSDSFVHSCPDADDIWLNAVALRSSVKVRQVVIVPKRFYEIPGTRTEALALKNNHQGGNDKQLAATYSDEDLSFLRGLISD